MQALRSKVVSNSVIGSLRDLSQRYGVDPQRMKLMLRAAQILSPAEVRLVEELLHLADRGASVERRSAVSQGVVRALAATPPESQEDPLAGLDDPMDAVGAAEACVRSELEVEARRREILRESVSVAEAAAATGRSRQAIERLRRAGRLLALRVGAQWRYPQWQFDPDAPGGVVPELDEVLGCLALSPAGAAVWLLTPNVDLDGAAPIVRLRGRRPEGVLRLARELAWMA